MNKEQQLQRVQEILKESGKQNFVPVRSRPPASVDNQSLIDEIESISRGETTATEPNKRSLGEKILGFTGGEEIAQGLGQAGAQGKTGKQIEDVQQRQMNTQTELLSLIKEKKTRGEDTTRLEGALEDVNAEIRRLGGSAESLLNPEELTEKQVVGDALQLATTAAGGKVAGKVAGKVTSGTGVLRGALQGAKTGALTGTALGALEGTAQGLQRDETLGQIAGSTVEGALVGGIGGALLGGLTGGVSGLAKGIKADKAQAHLKAITPEPKDLTPTEYENLLNRGKITPKTATEPARYIISPEEVATAEKYKSILGKDPAKNSINIMNEISKKDKEVGEFLRSKNGIFNTGELKNSLQASLDDITDVTIDEQRLARLKESTINNFISGLKKNDMESLWTARKEFDRRIEKAFTGSPTLQNEMKVAFRNAVQDFISQRTDDVTYKAYMNDMSSLFRIRDIVNTKATKEKGLNAIMAWARRNENTLKVVGGLGAIGTALGIGTNVVNALGE